MSLAKYTISYFFYRAKQFDHDGFLKNVEKVADNVCSWLITFILMTVIWVLVTLITDFQSVFYRKAIIYKRRIDTELEKRKI